MPPEEPDTGSYKIVFEIDYSHFVKLHGYLFGLQVVNKKFVLLFKKESKDWWGEMTFLFALYVFSAFWNFVYCLQRSCALSNSNLLFNRRHHWLHRHFKPFCYSPTMANFQQSWKTSGKKTMCKIIVVIGSLSFSDISGVRLYCIDGIFLLHGFHCPVCWPRWIHDWRIRASICRTDCCRGMNFFG